MTISNPATERQSAGCLPQARVARVVNGQKELPIRAESDAKTKQYVFNWGTKGLTAGIYELKIDLCDGVARSFHDEGARTLLECAQSKAAWRSGETLISTWLHPGVSNGQTRENCFNSFGRPERTPLKRFSSLYGPISTQLKLGANR